MNELELLQQINDTLQQSNGSMQTLVDNLQMVINNQNALALKIDMLYCLILAGIILLHWFRRRRTKWM